MSDIGEKIPPTISQGMYEHYCSIGVPYSGYVEGVGYVLPQVIVTQSPYNSSGTESIFNTHYANYLFEFDILEEQTHEIEANSSQPNREDYALIPRYARAQYGDNYLANAWHFTYNTLASVFNPLIDTVNGGVYSTQILYNEGGNAWWEHETGAMVNMKNGISNAVSNEYNYIRNSPWSKIWDDNIASLQDVESWENSVGFAGTLFVGGAVTKAGNVSKIGLYVTPKNFPSIRGGYGVFGQNGLNIRGYRVDMLYQNRNPLYGTYFSVKQNVRGGNLFRLDRGPIHGSYDARIHSTIRFNMRGQTFGSSAQRNWYPSTLKPPFFKPINKK